MKRFDFNGSKLSHSVEFPLSFSFNKKYMNEELQRKEQNGYMESPTRDDDLLFASTTPNTGDYSRVGSSRGSGLDSKFKTHRYELFGMIVHHGYSASRGHYYALTKVQNLHTS
jgi:hypothetical protein